MEESLLYERKKFYRSIWRTLFFLLVIILLYIVNDVFSFRWNEYGVHPRHIDGLIGILTMPFLHADYHHLFSNITPLFFLIFSINYFFEQKAINIIFMTCIISGLLTWSIGRQGNHIGASGIVYALSFFMVVISLIKKNTQLMAYSLIIIFLYGSLVWGIFPSIFQAEDVSWEGHLSGAITGVILAIFYRGEGPKQKEYFVDEENEEENEEENNYSGIQ